jgi:hypothetical protein
MVIGVAAKHRQPLIGPFSKGGRAGGGADLRPFDRPFRNRQYGDAIASALFKL